jgi:phosphoribosylformimino-5-aminoimidazole carboxamide ribotide isomerase
MIVIPAIDLRGGKVVRLTQGEYDKESRYGVSAGDTARRFLDAGAHRIHVVDLDGAREGKPLEMGTLEKLVREVPAQYEVGGGIRTPETIDRYLKLGVSYAVLGTRACLDRGFLREVLGAFGRRVIVGVDARDGRVATDGWTKVTDVKAHDLIDFTITAGGSQIIYTDISKDGMMQGPNLEQVKAVLKIPGASIIASGGVKDLDDIRSFLDLGAPNLLGAIVGKALYEGKLDLAEAVKLCQNDPKNSGSGSRAR